MLHWYYGYKSLLIASVWLVSSVWWCELTMVRYLKLEFPYWMYFLYLATSEDRVGFKCNTTNKLKVSTYGPVSVWFGVVWTCVWWGYVACSYQGSRGRECILCVASGNDSHTSSLVWNETMLTWIGYHNSNFLIKWFIQNFILYFEVYKVSPYTIRFSVLWWHTCTMSRWSAT